MLYLHNFYHYRPITAIWVIWAFFPMKLMGQNVDRPIFTLYEDALRLSNFSEIDVETQEAIFLLEDQNTVESVTQILGKYVDKTSSGTTFDYETVKEHFEGNDFLNVFFDGAGMPDALTPEAFEDVFVSSTELPGRGSSPSTTIVDGVGRFLARRFREELHVAFFEKFRDYLQEEPLLGGLFPQTSTVLSYIDSYLYSGRIKMIGGAFQSDIDSLIFHVNTVVSDPEIRAKLHLNPSAFLTFKSLFLGFQVAGGAHPANALYELSAYPEWDSLGPDFSKGLQLANILSEAFLTDQGYSTWVGPDALEHLKEDPILRRLFLGLLYERLVGVEITWGDTPQDLGVLLLENQDRLLEGEGVLGAAAEEDLKNFLTAGRQIPYDYLALDFSQQEDFGAVITHTLSAVNDVLGFLGHLRLKSGDGEVREIPGMQRILSFTKPLARAAPYAIDFYTHMRGAIEANGDTSRTRNFQDKAYYLGLAFMDLSRVFGEFATLYEQDSTLSDKEGRKFYKTAEKVFYYGTFISTVLTTEDAEDVSEIIERFALPSGSSRIKRESPFNISVNAFAGPSLGWETPSLNQLAFQNEVMLFTAPIGIAASTSLWKNRKGNGTSLSLFVSALDLGAVTLFRLNENNRFVSLPAAASFENLFAPGVHLIWGFADIPISAGIGFQRSASLRKISQDEVRVDPNAKFRLGVFVGVDIPMFNLYTNTSYKYSRWKFRKKE